MENMDNTIFDIQSALITAINNGCDEVVNYLISKGANVRAENNDTLYVQKNDCDLKFLITRLEANK